jgi:PTH1 family peptidyl-tRNA hydrolase
MNESGRSAGEAARYYKIDPSRIVVFHDELDLLPGKVRVKTGGGNAGHNGLKSLSEHLGNDYRRVRIGIGHPGDKALVHNYVLSDFAKAETAWVAALCDAIAAHAGLLVKGEDEAFQRKVQQAMETAGYGKAAPI